MAFPARTGTKLLAVLAASWMISGCSDGEFRASADASNPTDASADVSAPGDDAGSTPDTSVGVPEDSGSGGGEDTSSFDASSPDASEPSFDDLFAKAPVGVFTTNVCPEVRRVAGTTRYETAALISRGRAPNGAPSAVLASGADDAPDAVPSASLATSRNAPLLLTAQDVLPTSTRDELQRLGVQLVYLIGGTAVISQAVEDEVRSLGVTVQRVAGNTRFATAVEVSTTAGFASTNALITSGETTALIDSVTASSVAGVLKYPFLFVTSDSVPPETSQGLSSLGIQQTLVVGGTGAISDAVLAELPQPSRVAGTTRWSTSAAVAAEGVRRGIDPKQIFLVRPDGLGDSLAAAATNRLVLLTASDALSAEAANFIRNSDVANVILVGGESALSGSVERDVCDLLAPP